MIKEILSIMSILIIGGILIYFYRLNRKIYDIEKILYKMKKEDEIRPVIANRAPTVKDYRYPLCTFWFNKPKLQIWVLYYDEKETIKWTLIKK